MLLELIKRKKKSQKLYLTDYNSLTAQDIWQVRHQILNVAEDVNTDTTIKNVKLAELNLKIVTAF